jgi:D-alanine--poly(phosphoribitol) ligase subunit 1
MNILESIKTTALQHGNRIAIQSGLESLTYAQLEEYSNRLAMWMNRHYKDSKTPVIVYGHKNPFMIVCFLACVKSGRAYCPQDISIPNSRVTETIESVNPDMVLIVEGSLDVLAGVAGQTLKLDQIKNIIEEETEAYNDCFQVTPDDVYYIIFTSGSTGKPKGVQITTDCLNCYLDWSIELGSTKQDKAGRRFMNQAPFSFDLSVMDLYTSLACGGTLYTMDKAMQGDYAAMFDFFEASDLHIWVSTPSFADMCLSDKKFSCELLPNLQMFLFCGEVLTTSTAKNLMERFPNAKVINTYGPTESTVAVSDVEITADLLDEIMGKGKSLPVGHEKPGTWIEIWNDQQECCPEGEQGEIVIIGDTVSIGYYQREDLTEKVFLRCNRDEREWRAYKTGDAGYLIDGQLYYNGRIDLQVKLHGYRIEIEDIENNMVRLPEIDHAVVVPNVKEGKVKSLTAFVTGDINDQTPMEFSKHIKEELKAFLPAYMIPKKIKYMESIPMNNHGKADRKYLGGLV